MSLTGVLAVLVFAGIFAGRHAGELSVGDPDRVCVTGAVADPSAGAAARAARVCDGQRRGLGLQSEHYCPHRLIPGSCGGVKHRTLEPDGESRIKAPKSFNRSSIWLEIS